MSIPKQIYLAFVGRRDPYREQDSPIPGPNLNFLLDENCPLCAQIHFLVHKDVQENFKHLARELKERRFPEPSYTLYDGHPVDLSELMRFTQKQISALAETYGENTLIHCNVSPGTPQMQFALLLMAGKFENLSYYQIMDGTYHAKRGRIEKIEFPTELVQSGPPIAHSFTEPGKNLYGKIRLLLNELIEAQSRILIITGETGTGKTSLLHEYAKSKSLVLREVSPADLGSQNRIRKALKECGRNRGFPLVEWTRTCRPEHFPMILDCFDQSNFGGAIEMHTEKLPMDPGIPFKTLDIPPLRDRREDLLQATIRILEKYAQIFDINKEVPPQITRELLARRLSKNHYELDALLFFYIQTGTLPPEAEIDSRLPSASNTDFSLQDFLKEVEISILKDALGKYPNKAKAARALGMSANSFRKKICEGYQLVERRHRPKE